MLKELDLNVDVDVAFLAAQTPPIKIFPTPNTSHLPYNTQLTALESEYIKYYEYRGDLTYNENMKRSITKTENGKNAERTCLYRVCRDKNRFTDTRIKDDVLILGKILESMIERTSEMEKHLENVLLDAGEKELPNWDELYEEAAAHIAVVVSKKNYEKKVVPKNTEGPKVSATARKLKSKRIVVKKQSLFVASNQMNAQNQPQLTQEQAQMLIAQMMLARSH